MSKIPRRLKHKLMYMGRRVILPEYTDSYRDEFRIVFEDSYRPVWTGPVDPDYWEFYRRDKVYVPGLYDDREPPESELIIELEDES